jgi:hypothetical protein
MATRTQHRWIRTAVCAAVLAAMGALPVHAQEAADEAPAAEPSGPRTPGVSADAAAELARMTAGLQALQRFSVTADITRDEVLSYGYRLQNNERAQLWVERPNRLRLEVVGDIKNRTYVYDGSTLTMFAHDANAYATTAAPDSLRELVTRLLDAGVEMPLIDLLYHGSGGNLDEAVLAGKLVGDSTIAGTPVRHLAFRQAEVDWQIWIETSPRALPRKLVITTRYSLGDPQYSATLNWNVDERADAGRFKFSPPAGATKIPFATELFSSGDAE